MKEQTETKPEVAESRGVKNNGFKKKIKIKEASTDQQLYQRLHIQGSRLRSRKRRAQNVD